MEMPEDVRRLMEELRRRGVRVPLVAVEKTPAPRETYDVWREEGYAGTLPADEVYRERDFVACGKLTCSVFLRDAMRYVYRREDRRLYEPEEW